MWISSFLLSLSLSLTYEGESRPCLTMEASHWGLKEHEQLKEYTILEKCKLLENFLCPPAFLTQLARLRFFAFALRLGRNSRNCLAIANTVAPSLELPYFHGRLGPGEADGLWMELRNSEAPPGKGSKKQAKRGVFKCSQIDQTTTGYVGNLTHGQRACKKKNPG